MLEFIDRSPCFAPQLRCACGLGPKPFQSSMSFRQTRSLSLTVIAAALPAAAAAVSAAGGHRHPFRIAEILDRYFLFAFRCNLL